MIRFEDEDHPGAVVRLASQEDNSELLDIFGDVPMKGELVLTTERAPAFFGLYDIQDVEVACSIYEREDRILALGSFLIRPGFVHGERRTVCYLGDLRVRPEGAGLISRFYGEVFEAIQRRWDVEHFYTGILASNAKALHALTKRSEKRFRQPDYTMFRRFDAVQVQFTRRPRANAQTNPWSVRRATQADVPAIVKLLADDHERRPFGYDYRGSIAEDGAVEGGEFMHRLDHWPDFTLDSTFVCITSGGDIVGVCTAWDAASLKRYRVLEYRGKMRWIKRAFNFGASVMRYPPLPPEGECFRYFYLANLSIVGDDWRILRCLIDGVYRAYERAGYNFMMLYMEDNSPLRPALDGVSTRSLPFHLYTVASPGTPAVDYGDGQAGFEIALA